MATLPFSLNTVFIACYNHRGFLPAAVESVLAQNYQYKEIIVVDKGSTDNTKELHRNVLLFEYVYQANQGFSAARNKGIAESSGNYFFRDLKNHNKRQEVCLR